MGKGDKAFTGSIPAIYDEYLVPVFFAPYAEDLVRRLGGVKRGRLLEIAAGSGAATRAMARALPPAVSIVATDLNQPMLDTAAGLTAAANVEWRQADAQALPFEGASFDAVVCQFGVMFFPDKAAGFSQARRVLRPGGRFLCLEFSSPRRWLAPAYGLWSRTAIPALGAAVSGRIEAYRYLVESIARFPDQRAFAELIAAAGFADVGHEDLSFGIAAIHGARRP